ncbi:hypothetical protein AeRB84_006709 [Aphanomyces euteiches]|nr:hypothetical protein AeRB84_006709 [Aphanomyces euteiches]
MSNPRDLTGKEIQDTIKWSLGHVSSSAASRVKTHLVKSLYGDIDLAFEKLGHYFSLVKEKNPGTIAEVETINGFFHRSVLVPKFCISSIAHCQPVVALDGTHLKDLMNSRGVLLVASIKDPNNHLLVLGLAVVPTENYDNWSWFIKQLKLAGVIHDDIVLISGRDKGLMKACKDICPNNPHRFCLRHIVANIRANKKMWLTAAEENIVYQVANASSRDSFARYAEKLRTRNPGNIHCYGC